MRICIAPYLTKNTKLKGIGSPSQASNGHPSTVSNHAAQQLVSSTSASLSRSTSTPMHVNTVLRL